MVQKSRNSNTRLHHAQRNYSGGNAKTGLNQLHLTQRESSSSRQQLKAGNSTVDLQQGRMPAQFARQPHLTSNSRVRSKDRIAPLAQKLQDAPAAAKGKSAQRAGFSIARSDDTDEDDDGDWVSSESGAATPQNVDSENSDEDVDNDGAGSREGAATPVESHRRPRATRKASNRSETTVNGNGGTDRMTSETQDRTPPRVQTIVDLPRVDIVRPDNGHIQSNDQSSQQQPQQPKGPAQVAQQPPLVRVIPQSTPASPDPPPVATKVSPKKPIRQTRSEAPSPPKTATKRLSLMRNSTQYGESKEQMPHHPLIRGQSYHGSSLRPAPLAPLTVNSEAAQAQMTPSPSRANSPPYSAGLQHSPQSTSSQVQLPSRKGSFSSLHSVATLPAPSSRFFGGGVSAAGKMHPDRSRTMSTISNSSSSAALSALNMLPAASRPSSPPMVVHFPPESRKDMLEGLHQLLPPPYAPSHMTVIAKYNPLGDCYERVMRAKRGQQ